MLTCIQQYLRAVTPIGREHERVGPFLATFDPHSDNPYLNYALPDDGAEPSDYEVAVLVDAYRAAAPPTSPRVHPRLCAGGRATAPRRGVLRRGAPAGHGH